MKANKDIYARFPQIAGATIDLVVEHMNDMPRIKLARLAGMSTYTLYNIIHTAGGQIDHSRSTRQEAWRDTVRRLWPDHTGTEIQALTGMRFNRAEKIARELGLKHSAETMQRIKAKRAEELKRVHHDPEAQRRKTAKWKATRRLDEMRVLACEPQRTRFKFCKEPKGAYSIRHLLLCRYNYFTADGDKRTFYYDAETRRTPKEAYHTRKYGFKFAPANPQTDSQA